VVQKCEKDGQDKKKTRGLKTCKGAEGFQSGGVGKKFSVGKGERRVLTEAGKGSL